VRQGATYIGRLGILVDADLQKLVGWEGAVAHVSIHQVHGEGLSSDFVQNLMTVSGIEALPSTRLFNVWVEQSFGNNTSLRIGQFAASQEFVVSNNANLFVNSTFAWPEIASADLPSGAPNYPLATPGIRVKTSPADDVRVLAAIFNGDPAGSALTIRLCSSARSSTRPRPGSVVCQPAPSWAASFNWAAFRTPAMCCRR
jgi:porin